MTPVPSGIPDVDRQWGGLAEGSAYLLVGRAGAGRSALALQTAHAAVEAGSRCLLISPRAPEALVEVGQGAGIDLARDHGTGRLRILRIPAAADLAARGPEGLAQAYRDLTGLVQSDRPDRLVIEDFTPLVQFDTFERFHESFSGLISALREAGITFVLGLGDPANDASHRLLGVVEALVAGAIRLTSDGELALATSAAEADTSAPAESVEWDASSPEAADVPSPAEPASEPYSGNDGASVPTGEAVPTPSGARGQRAADGPPSTDIIPAPPIADDLLHPTEDPFGVDPVEAIMEQGFIADSGLIPALEEEAAVAVAPPAEALAFTEEPDEDAASWTPEAPDSKLAAPEAPVLKDPSDTEGEPASEPTPAPVPLPSFAPLGGVEPAPEPAGPPVEFRPALQAAFDASAPFLVVALRMEPAAPGAAYFDAVHDGLRNALREDDRLLVDTERKRAVALLPDSGAEASQALFAGLQEHLRETLGDQAAQTLAAVGAVTIPNGQPFTSADDLMAYAFEG